MASRVNNQQTITTGRRRWPVILFVLIVAIAGFLLMLRRAVRATNRDAWACSVVDVISAATLKYMEQSNASPESIDQLVATGFLIVDTKSDGITISTPEPYYVGPVRIDSLSKIRLRLPKSIEGWRVVGDSVVGRDGEEIGLSLVEIVGETYLPDGLAQRANRRFARQWFEATRGE